MNENILIELTVCVKAESKANNELLCAHSGVYKQSVSPKNMEIAQMTLVNALYDTADIIKKIGSEEN